MVIFVSACIINFIINNRAIVIGVAVGVRVKIYRLIVIRVIIIICAFNFGKIIKVAPLTPSLIVKVISTVALPPEELVRELHN